MRRSKKSWPRAGAALAALVLLCGAVAAFGLAEATKQPTLRRETLIIPDWPQNAPPVRIGLLADIHLGNRAMTSARLRAIVAKVNEAHADVVMIAGDFITGHEAKGAAERASLLSEPLATLHAPLGVVAVLGNHDYWTAPGAVRLALQRAGITVLENAALRRGPLAIIGVSDAFSGHDDVAKAMIGAAQIGGVRVVLTHTPDLDHKLPVGLPLLLAGHTHCGQVVLPWLGPIMTRSPFDHWKRLYDPRYRCGIVREDGRTVIVTAGLGSGSSPIRIGAPPDWWLITLRGAARPSGVH